MCFLGGDYNIIDHQKLFFMFFNRFIILNLTATNRRALAQYMAQLNTRNEEKWRSKCNIVFEQMVILLEKLLSFLIYFFIWNNNIFKKILNFYL